MTGFLELPEDGDDVAAVDGSDFSGPHDHSPCLIGTDFVELQVLGDGFQIQELQLQLLHRLHHQIGQLYP